jgi:hypothetical protein
MQLVVVVCVVPQTPKLKNLIADAGKVVVIF